MPQENRADLTGGLSTKVVFWDEEASVASDEEVTDTESVRVEAGPDALTPIQEFNLALLKETGRSTDYVQELLRELTVLEVAAQQPQDSYQYEANAHRREEIVALLAGGMEAVADIRYFDCFSWGESRRRGKHSTLAKSED